MQRLTQSGQRHEALCQRRLHSWQRRLDAHHHITAQSTEQLRHHAHAALQQFRANLRRLEKRLALLEPNRQLGLQRRLWGHAVGRLNQHATAAVSASRHALLPQSRRFNRAMGEFIPEQRHCTAATAGKLFALDPTGVLKRGYSLAYAADGRLVSTVRALASGDALNIRFHDGVAATRVESTRENKT